MRWLLALIAALCADVASAQMTPSLFTDRGSVKTFSLIDQDGKTFTPEKLRGKVWIAHFFFTTCTKGCEKTKVTMRQLQDKIRGKSDLALVSISVNPETDTPETLSIYAKEMNAEPGQWTFLTGSQSEVHDVVQKVFGETAMRTLSSLPIDEQITHSFNLLIVDREGNIVGYHDGKDADDVPKILDRVRGVASARYVLPSVNAALNATAGFLLVVGYLAIRRRKIGLHKTAMLSAFVCSSVFLGCYLYYHFVVLRGESPRLVAAGGVRIVYLTILLTHTVLAVAVAPLAIVTTYRGLTNQLARHVKVARWTLPIWLYVSVTGVVVYVMLYHFYPPY